MADFRKWLLTFAVVALLLGMGNAANAQVAFSCVANADIPPVARVEGLTELVGDLTLNCTGGTPTLKGADIPLYNITILLNTNITSRLIDSGNLSEATLMIDEPHADGTNGNTPIPDQSVVLPTPGSPPQILCGSAAFPGTGQGNVCPEVGTFAGVPSPSPYAAQANVFSGRQNGPFSIRWLGVPIDAPGTAGTRLIRVTNVRASAFQLGLSSTQIPQQITMNISVNGSQQVAITNPTQTVAFNQLGLPVGSSSAALRQCTDQNPGLIGGSGGTTSQFGIKVSEGFASSFKRKNISLSGDGVTSPAPLAQNVPGYPYNTESGFFAPNLFEAIPFVGLANAGTRILLRFNNVGAGVHIFVPTQLPLLLSDDTTPSTPPLPPSGATSGCGGTTLSSCHGELLLVSTDVNGAGPSFLAVSGSGGLAEVSYSGTLGYATYEVINSDPNALEHADIPVYIAFFSKTTQNLPAPGNTTVNVSFAALSNVSQASSDDPNPRFGDDSTPMAAFSINPCTSCTFSLTPPDQSFGPSGGVGSFTVSTAPTCTWKPVSGAGWITILPSGSKGVAKVNYAIQANGGVARTGTISVGGQNYNIDESGGSSCSYSIGPTFASPSNSGGNVSVSVSAPSSCSWTAVSNTSWVTVKSGASGSGGGVVVLNVAPNTGGQRSGIAAIAGQTFSVTQGAGACGALDISSQVSVTRTQLIPIPFSTDFSQSITVRNNSGAVVHGPIYVTLLGEPTHYGFPNDSFLVGNQLETTCFSTQGDYLLPVSGDLQPGQTAGYALLWTAQTFGIIQYTTKVLSGTPSH
jgi:hypothetical protein